MSPIPIERDARQENPWYRGDHVKEHTCFDAHSPGLKQAPSNNPQGKCRKKAIRRKSPRLYSLYLQGRAQLDLAPHGLCGLRKKRHAVCRSDGRLHDRL